MDNAIYNLQSTPIRSLQKVKYMQREVITLFFKVITCIALSMHIRIKVNMLLVQDDHFMQNNPTTFSAGSKLIFLHCHNFYIAKFYREYTFLLLQNKLYKKFRDHLSYLLSNKARHIVKEHELRTNLHCSGSQPKETIHLRNMTPK